MRACPRPPHSLVLLIATRWGFRGGLEGARNLAGKGSDWASAEDPCGDPRSHPGGSERHPDRRP